MSNDKEASYSCGVTLKNSTEPEMLMTANFVPSSVSSINIDGLRMLANAKVDSVKKEEKVSAKSDPIIDP